MNPEQALQFIEQVRQRTSLAGSDHDAFRQAIQVLQGAIIQAEQLKTQVVDLTSKLATKPA